jgi:MoxR-like ATPase
MAVEDIAKRVAGIQANIEQVIEGKPDVVRLSLITLLSEGHLLLEDVPGVGKTLLAKAIARSVACSVRRIQFTPDLLPSDITGVTIYNQERADFEFKPGAVFANIVLGDEINRAGPKTQSALLEAMEERTVTADGTTRRLAAPFMVIATQNPIELDGTYPLPEAQRDRFMTRLEIGYPSVEAELDVLERHGRGTSLERIQPVTDARHVTQMIEAVKGIYAAQGIQRYIVDIVRSTREHPSVELGASPRAAIALLRGARSLAGVEGRDYVIPDDVKALSGAVLAHRLVLAPQAHLDGLSAMDAVADVVGAVPVPRGAD